MATPNPQTLYEDALAAAASAKLSVLGFGELTSADEVRSVFGLSDAEIPDDMLSQNIYSAEIGAALTKVLGDKALTWLALTASFDEKDIKLVQATKNWVVYAYADKICDVLPLVVAKALTDNKASYTRFDYDVAALVANIRKRFMLAEKALQTALEAEVKPMVLPTLFGVGKPTYDPVTNQGAR